MKKSLLALLVVLLGLSSMTTSTALAQTPITTGDTDLDAERARLADERKTIDTNYDRDRAACYKKFAVEGCLQDSRERRRTATDDLHRQEAAINDIERKRRGAAEIDKLDKAAADARSPEQAAKREEALKSQQQRDQAAAEHAANRAQIQAKEAAERRAFEQKQRNNADEQAKLARQRAAEPEARQTYQDKLTKAQQQREDLARRNAQNTKPRSAPLPEGATPPGPPVPIGTPIGPTPR